MRITRPCHKLGHIGGTRLLEQAKWTQKLTHADKAKGLKQSDDASGVAGTRIVLVKLEVSYAFFFFLARADCSSHFSLSLSLSTYKVHCAVDGDHAFPSISTGGR